tara:strand:- start:788020 stop:788709 length:690 start_codon:yes stop_codon:yes gene_type:complete
MGKNKSNSSQSEWTDWKKWIMGLLSHTIGVTIAIFITFVVSVNFFYNYQLSLKLDEAKKIHKEIRQLEVVDLEFDQKREAISNESKELIDAVSDISSYLKPYLYGDGAANKRDQFRTYLPMERRPHDAAFRLKLMFVVDLESQTAIENAFGPTLSALTALENELSNGTYDLVGPEYDGRIGNTTPEITNNMNKSRSKLRTDLGKQSLDNIEKALSQTIKDLNTVLKSVQ